MRRADRLFSIIQLLRRRRRAVTARTIAETLEVSERTVYRDIRDLVSAGTPIEGEAGVGYTLRREYDLPPLMFDAEEIQALVLGARIVSSHADTRLARAAEQALSKIEAVLPKHLRALLDETGLYAVRTSASDLRANALDVIRASMNEKKKLRFDYRRGDGASSSRVVRPLGAFFWGDTWTLTAWCELRDDFRNFRLDRVGAIETLEQGFTDEAGKTLRDYVAREGGEGLLSG